MNKSQLIVIIYSLFVLIAVSNAFAYDNKLTHPRVSEKAVNNANLESYIVENLGYPDGFNLIVAGKKVAQWISDGSFEEDEPNCRASNHFFNPLNDWGAAKLGGLRGRCLLCCYRRKL